MLNVTHYTPFSTHYPTSQQDDAAPQRKKRSIDTPQTQLAPEASSDGSSRNGQRRGGSGLDSLGKGNLL